MLLTNPFASIPTISTSFPVLTSTLILILLACSRHMSHFLRPQSASKVQAHEPENSSDRQSGSLETSSGKPEKSLGIARTLFLPSSVMIGMGVALAGLQVMMHSVEDAGYRGLVVG